MTKLPPLPPHLLVDYISEYPDGLLFEGKPAEFCYDALAKKMWQDKCRDAHNETGIVFDHENDDPVASRDIVIDQDRWPSDCKFRCELRRAGGDWESSAYYFRCELVDGYAKGVNQYEDPFFVVIPGPEDGNDHLIQKGGDYHLPDSDYDGETGSEMACWKYLKGYLDDLVKQEIDEQGPVQELPESVQRVRIVYLGGESFDFDDDGYREDLIGQAWELAKASPINVLSDKDINSVAIINDMVVGALFTAWNQEEFSFDVIVSPQYQRMGVGKQLVDSAIAEFSQVASDLPEAHIKADVVNDRMVEILKRYGFEVFEIVHGHTIMTYG